MASVSQLVDALSRATDMPKETVSSYARALIDAGLLPKSSGRAVAQVTLRHYTRLLTAIALEPKIKDAGAAVADYLALPIAGLAEGVTPVAGNMTAEDGIVRLLGLLQNKFEPTAPKQRCAVAESKVTFVRNFQLIEIAVPLENGLTETYRFKPAGTHQKIDGSHLRRACTVGADLVTLVSILIDPSAPAPMFASSSALAAQKEV